MAAVQRSELPLQTMLYNAQLERKAAAAGVAAVRLWARREPSAYCLWSLTKKEIMKQSKEKVIVYCSCSKIGPLTCQRVIAGRSCDRCGGRDR